MTSLHKAYLAAVYGAIKTTPEHRASYELLESILYDLDCYFSEQGITAEQRERLKKMGFPELQD